jgi:aerobic carbon-monoxide dehydrogenase large subunit
MRWVGRPLPRYEDPILLRGRGRYTADLARGARILRFVRSPVARGRILAVDAPPGVPIITAAALGEVKPICPRLDRPDYIPVAQPILAGERVNYVGEPIAAVIADTAAEAEDLAEQVTIEIDAETPVVTLDEALASDAPLVHDTAARNTLIDARFETASVAAALAAADQRRQPGPADPAAADRRQRPADRRIRRPDRCRAPLCRVPVRLAVSRAPSSF